MNIPEIEVGILFSPVIRFRLNGDYTLASSGRSYGGDFSISKNKGTYYLSNGADEEEISFPAVFTPGDYAVSDFDLTDVVIGIHFHWERKENQKFKGTLKIIDENEYLTAINILSLEDYLLSVISSEMNASSSLELLKAHAVISRSWLLAQKDKATKLGDDYQSVICDDTQYIRWYDREDHEHFDVCADDHCQRYQGISRACTPTVRQAIEATYGEVLTYNGTICDARFSKCCGGVSEKFENTWEPVNHPYLDKVTDSKPPVESGDLSGEQEAKRWILSTPGTFCNTSDEKVLSAVLNDYDRETHHFFRWTIVYTSEEISALIHKRLGIDFGTITDLTPIERGVSGRIIRLKVTGTRKTMTIGKELVIRKAFSESHLYSSAFVAEKTERGFIFHGAGWGHGVGLCQIGAAVMGAQGYTYREILQHYFPGSQLTLIYLSNQH